MKKKVWQIFFLLVCKFLLFFFSLFKGVFFFSVYERLFFTFYLQTYIHPFFSSIFFFIFDIPEDVFVILIINTVLKTTQFLPLQLSLPFTDGEVYEFKCSVGLLFDIDRQICDFKSKVFNCGTHIRTYFRVYH